MKRLWVILTLLIIFSCEDDKDTTPPEVTITAPSSGSTVNEVVNVTCMATDNKEVSKVELWVDGVNTGLTDDTEPYSFQWNTTKYNDGDHTLIVRGYDTSENEGDSPPVTVKIDNTVSVPNSISVKSADFSSGGFTIEWSKSTDGDFKSYTIEHSVEPQMNDYENIFTAEDVNVTTTRMENTSPLIYHYFRVTVTDTFLYQTKGAIFTSKLDPIPDSVDVKSVTYDLEKMTVEWDESKESDFGSYKLLYSKTESGDRDTIETYSDKTTTTYSTTTYDPTIENWYWVIVADTLGQSKVGNGKTNTIDSPPTVTEIDSTVFNNSDLYIYWTVNTDDDFSSLTVYESNSKDMSNSTVVFSSQDQTLYRADVYNYPTNVIRYYQIEVKDKWGLKSQSSIVAVSSLQKIVFVSGSSGTSRLYTMDIEGNALTKPIEPYWDSNSYYYPQFSPDGKKIIYVTNARNYQQYGVFIMNVDGSGKTNLGGNHSSRPNRPKYSPDGSKIVLYSKKDGSKYEIYLIDLDKPNNDWVRLTNNNNQERYPFFSPDGNKVLFQTDRDGNNEIYIMDLDGSNQTNLTKTDVAIQTYDSEIQPIWDNNCTSSCHISSNLNGGLNLSSSISYSEIVNVASQGYSGLMRVKPEDPNNSVLYQKIIGNTSFGDRMPKGGSPLDQTDEDKIKKWIEDGATGWTAVGNADDSYSIFGSPFSPDGSKIVFSSNRTGYNEVYIMDIDGSNQTQITNNAYNDYNPLFTPDGKKIVFDSTRDGGSEIYIMDIDGTNQTNLTMSSGGYNYLHQVSYDGKKILFIATRNGNNEIFIMDIDGTNQTNLTNNSEPDNSPHLQPRP